MTDDDDFGQLEERLRARRRLLAIVGLVLIVAVVAYRYADLTGRFDSPGSITTPAVGSSSQP